MHLWFLALAGCGGAPAPTSPPATERAAEVELVAAPAGLLLFVSERGEAPSTWQVRTDGTGEQPVKGPAGAVFPGAADPKRAEALLVGASDGADGHLEQLWLAPLDGGLGTNITPAAQKLRNPAWSPDGSWLVFESDALSYRDLFRVDRTGGALTRLTEAEHGSFEPDVSADGSRIAFGTSRDGNAEVYTMAADGTDPVRVTRHPSDDVRPKWHPDGGSLAWMSLREGRMAVFTVTAGGQPKRLRPAEGEAVDLDLAWSPDGSHLAVTVQTGPKEVQVEIVQWPTGKRVAVLDGPGPDEHPAWSPDGTWIAFSSARSGSPAIWLDRRDGGAARQVSSGQTDWLPRWVR